METNDTAPDTPDLAAETSAPATPPVPPNETAPAPRRSRSWIGWLVLILIVAVAVWFGWRWWQQRAGTDAATSARLAAVQQAAQKAAQQAADQSAAATRALDQRVAKLDANLDAAAKARAALGARLDQQQQQDASAAARNAEQLTGLNQRVEHLEAAVASLSERQFSGHDEMLIDDAEMLLQLASQRYTVLGDAGGAARALELAQQALAGVDDASFAAVRRTIASERKQLAASQAVAGDAAVETVAKLRARWSTLPLKPLDQPASTDQSAWQRIWKAVAGLVTIRRDDARSLDDARLARELAVLDLASAQAALLNRDRDRAHAALARVAASLTRDLDPAAAGVRSAKAELDHLLSLTQPAATPQVELGAALRELRNLRGVKAVAPAAATRAPATAKPTPTPTASPATSGAAAAAAGNAPATAGSAP